MKISELPTPRLRARAMELAAEYQNGEIVDYGLFSGLCWELADEDWEFWNACWFKDWDKAKELEPSLFKPMDGKPHFAVRKYEMPEDEFYGLIVENYELFKVDDLELCWKYIQEVDPEEHTTIQEAVQALYSFKREEMLMKDHNRPDWATLITTLGNHISSGNRTEEVDMSMSMWDTLFPLAKEESCGTHVARYLATYRGDKYELFTDIKGTPLCINKIIERITLNKKARQIEWSEAIVDEEYTYYLGSLGRGSIYTIYEKSYFDRIWAAPRYDYFDDMCQLELSSIDQAKQACQEHLQAYVDGLYSQLQQLTEEK